MENRCHLQYVINTLIITRECTEMSCRSWNGYFPRAFDKNIMRSTKLLRCIDASFFMLLSKLFYSENGGKRSPLAARSFARF